MWANDEKWCSSLNFSRFLEEGHYKYFIQTSGDGDLEKSFYFCRILIPQGGADSQRFATKNISEVPEEPWVNLALQILYNEKREFLDKYRNAKK